MASISPCCLQHMQSDDVLIGSNDMSRANEMSRCANIVHVEQIQNTEVWDKPIYFRNTFGLLGARKCDEMAKIEMAANGQHSKIDKFMEEFVDAI